MGILHHDVQAADRIHRDSIGCELGIAGHVLRSSQAALERVGLPVEDEHLLCRGIRDVELAQRLAEADPLRAGQRAAARLLAPALDRNDVGKGLRIENVDLGAQGVRHVQPAAADHQVVHRPQDGPLRQVAGIKRPGQVEARDARDDTVWAVGVIVLVRLIRQGRQGRQCRQDQRGQRRQPLFCHTPPTLLLKSAGCRFSALT